MLMYSICTYPHKYPINNLSIDNFIRTFLHPGFLPDLSYANFKIKFCGEYLTYRHRRLC